MLQIVDAQWKDHLYSLDHLKEGIGLRGYGQRDPLVEYKKESFALFQDMKDRIDEEMVRYLCWLRPVSSEEAAPQVRRPAPPQRPADVERAEPVQQLLRLGAAAARRAVRPSRRGPAATMRRSRPSGATSRRSAGTTPARAAAGRSTRSATAPR